MESKKVFKFTKEVILLSGVVISPVLFAQADAADAVDVNGELAPYVVVATRTPLGLDRVSPSVSYISAEEMEFWQDRDLVDALRRETGVAIWSNGTPGNSTSLSIRGTETRHSSVFLDGRRLNPGSDNRFNLSNLALNSLQSVQLQKGASSVNSGSAGIGGTIELQSLSAIDMAPGVSGSIAAEYGSYDYTEGVFNVRSTGENYGVSLSGTAFNAQNKRPNDQFESKALQSRVDYLITDQVTVELVSSYIDSDNNSAGPKTSPSTANWDSVTSWLLSPGVKYTADALTVHSFYSRTEYAYDYGTYPIWHNMQTDEFNVQFDYTLMDSYIFSVGSVYRNDHYLNNNAQTGSYEQLGYWLQLQAQLSKQFEARAGLRYDDYSDYDESVTGEISLSYFVSRDFSIFSKLGTSYAPPTPFDLATDNTPLTSLSVEESVSYELGIRQFLPEYDLMLNLTAFRNEISNLKAVGPGGYNWGNHTADLVSVGQATTEGVEFQVEYTPNVPIEFTLGYTYLTALKAGERLAYRPRHSLQATMNWQVFEEFSVGFQSLGVFDRREGIYDVTPAKDYIIFNLVSDLAINNEWSVYGRVENLTDKKYETLVGYPSLGRAGYVGVKYSF